MYYIYIFKVISLLRRMLSEISPEIFAKIVGVKTLPAKDFSIITVANKDINSEKFDIDQYVLCTLRIIDRDFTVYFLGWEF